MYNLTYNNMEAVFKDCTFISVKNIPNVNKSKLMDSEGKTFDKCLFLIEEGNPCVLYNAKTKEPWYRRIDLTNKFRILVSELKK